MSNLVAYKSNFLVEASYKMTLSEQRFILTCIGKLDPREEVPEKITVTADELYQSFPDIGFKHKEEKLMEAVDKLWNRSVIVKDPDQTEEFRWIQSRIRYHKGEARVTVKFSNDVKKYLTQLSGQFTKVALNNVSGLSSVYSIRIYELCQQFIKTGERTILIEDLRSYLQTEDSYGQFRDFNKWVIKPAIKELNKKSNLKIDVLQQKRGRRIHALSFVFKEKDQLELDV